MKLPQVFGCYQPIVGMEECLFSTRLLHNVCAPSSLSPLLYPSSRSHHGFPVANHRVHYHIENCWRQWFALGDPSLCVEGCSVVPSHPRHHLQPLQINSEEVKGPVPHTISLQDTQAPVPIQGVVSLVHFQEDRMEDHLPQVRNLLKQLDLKCGSPCTATRPESVEGVVRGDAGGEAAIE